MANAMQEDYLCDHFSFIVTYSDAKSFGGVSVMLTYLERHREMTVEDYRGMLKAMMRLDERIGDVGDN